MKIIQINPLSIYKTEFASTKELYTYAKNKIVNCAKKQNKEYLIIADTKKNKILLETIGEEDFVDIPKEFKFPKEWKNIALLHGHPTRKSSPLSRYDCYSLCCDNYEKVIAFNKKGRFSILQKKHNSNIEEAKMFFKYGILFEESPLLPKES